MNVPEIPGNCWRTDKPVIAERSNGEKLMCYFEKIKEVDGQMVISVDYDPVFVSRDRYQETSGEILTDIVAWNWAY